MKIVICGSMAFAEEIMLLGKKLEENGCVCTLPKDIDLHADGGMLVESAEEKMHGDLIRRYFDKIKEADVVLIANYTKNDIENYLGGNTLIEMAFAHILHKPLYLLNPIPQMSYTDEIQAM